MLAMRRFGDATLRRMTVAQLMDRLGQSERARQCFWYPLSIATLNDEPELSSAQLLAEVLKRAFFSRRRRDSAFVYSRVGLSDLYCTGARGSLSAPAGRGLALDRRSARTWRRRQRRKRAAARRAANRGVQFYLRGAGAPVAPNPARKRGRGSIFRALAGLTSSPIICVHVWLDREVTDSPFIGFIGTTTQWLFNKRRIFAQRGERIRVT